MNIRLKSDSKQIRLTSREYAIKFEQVGKRGLPGEQGEKGDKGDQGDPATNLVQSVNGKQGVVTLDNGDVGLSNVPNTDFTDAVALNTAKRSYPQADQDKLATVETGAQVNEVSADDLALKANKTYVDTGYSSLELSRPYSVISDVQSGHGFTTEGSGIGTVDLDDTTDFIRGSQAITLTTNGTASTIGVRLDKEFTNPLDLTDQAVRILVKVDNPDTLAELSLQVGEKVNGSLTNNFYWRRYNGTLGAGAYNAGQWRWITFKWSDVYQGNGSYSLSAAGRIPSKTSGFTTLRLVVKDNGAPTTVHVQAIETMPAKSSLFPNGVTSITFDDGWDSVYHVAFPLMQKYGLRGVIYTIAEYIGQPGRLTLNQLKELQDAGWEIAGHSYTGSAHNGFNTLTSQELRTDVAALRKWLISNGFPADSIAYPRGQHAKTTDGVNVMDIVGEYFNTARTIYALESTEVLLETIPTMEPLALHSLDSITDLSTAPAPRQAVNLIGDNGAIKDTVNYGGWFIQTYHKLTVEASVSSDNISAGAFEQILIATKNSGLEVLTANEVMRRFNDADRANIGLGKVDNTSDFAKPISIATQLALDEKVAKTIDASKVYSTDSNGTQSTLNYSQFSTANHLVQRATGGQINVPTPSSTSHATSKNYVDTADAAKVNKSGDTMSGTLSTQALVPSSHYAYNVGSATARYDQAYVGVLNIGGASGIQFHTNNASSIGTSTSVAANIHTTQVTLGGIYQLTGTGFPNGVVSAPVGSIYIDKAVTNGASSWIKKSGTGNTGWQVLEGDTGWRNVTSLFPHFEVVSGNDYGIRWRRAGNINYLEGTCQIKAVSTTPFTLDLAMQARSDASVIRFEGQGVMSEVVDMKIVSTTAYPVPSASASVGRRGYINASYGVSVGQSTTWPTTLPGTAV